MQQVLAVRTAAASEHDHAFGGGRLELVRLLFACKARLASAVEGCSRLKDLYLVGDVPTDIDGVQVLLVGDIHGIQLL